MGVGIMSSVPNELRGQANGMSVFTMHLLGDLFSPFIIGFLSDAIGMYTAYIILTAWLFFGSFAWFLSWRCAVTLTQKYPNRSLVNIGTCGMLGTVKTQKLIDSQSGTEEKIV